MNAGLIILLGQAIAIPVAILLLGWQIYKLRQAIQVASCQDIIEKYFRIVENPDFQQTFSFGPDWQQFPEAQKKKAAICSMVFAFLEQIYVQAGGGQLAQRLSGPWVEFVKTWIRQDGMKQYWGSAAMICPKSGFDEGFQEFVDEIYKAY